MILCRPSSFFFFFNDTATTEIYTLSLHDALQCSDIAKGISECPLRCLRFRRRSGRLSPSAASAIKKTDRTAFRPGKRSGPRWGLPLPPDWNGVRVPPLRPRMVWGDSVSPSTLFSHSFAPPEDSEESPGPRRASACFRRSGAAGAAALSESPPAPGGTERPRCPGRLRRPAVSRFEGLSAIRPLLEDVQQNHRDGISPSRYRAASSFTRPSKSLASTCSS